MDKFEIAQILREIGIIIELTDKNPKKGLAYRKAAHTVETIPDLHEAVKEKSLETFPGIGSHISKMISTLVQKRSLEYYENLKELIPQSLLKLQRIPGLSINRIKALYEIYHVTNQEELEKTLSNASFVKVKGFGPAFIKKIIARIARLKAEGYSLLYPEAMNIAYALMEVLGKHVNKIEITGALRRKLELVNQVDLIADSHDPVFCFSIFLKHGLVEKVLSKTKKTISVLLKQGIVANLHIVDSDEYIFNLTKLTGNEKHLHELEEQAIAQGYSSLDNLKHKVQKDENRFYQMLGLPYICPELREGFGEIEAARKKILPHLIEENDLKGIFHCHTIDSDGTNTPEQLATAAKNLKWEYVGISDHSKSSYQANGMDEERLMAQIDKIHKINAELDPSFQFFAGIECDVLKDGGLDFSDDILCKLDFVIISIHRYFNMEEDKMTKRLLKAIENPYTTIVGHLTGRLLRHRDPYALNVPKIIDACVANDKIIELNAYPSRLDMDWRYWIKGKEKGLKCAINPDAHSIRDFQNCRYGINMARKGWLEKNDVINTLSLKEMKAFLKKRNGK